MNPERVARLKEIFLTAGRLPEEERSAYLDRACAEDAALREEVDSLLGRVGNTADVRRAAAIPALAPATAERLPERIAEYRVLGLLGEGGMGVVYRAEQEHPVRREVAVKVSRVGLESAGLPARFESERQVLARMDHPHIARLLDAGSTDEGRAYFVMELVRGVPLTEYCRQAGLSTRRRVELFLKTVQGVKHAHQHGIVHRDLKPSNILVALSGDEPVPKVIDFSVAKALGDPLLAAGDRTRTGQLVGTLDFMAPEQALGRTHQIDARTDVYALGVLLHVLLNDRLPIDVAGLPLHEAIQKIATDPPLSLRGARTRNRTTSSGSSRIDPDLATIADKCLEKEPDLRYPSAAELAEDLERYLGARPILARPTSKVYQFRKLVRRHPVAFGSIGAAFVVLAAFAATVTYQLGVQRAERARADRQAEKAQLVNEFLVNVLDEANREAGGRLSDRLGILDRASRRIESDLGQDPELRAEVLELLARHSGQSDLGIDLQRRAALARVEWIGTKHRAVAEELTPLRELLDGTRAELSEEDLAALGRPRNERLRSDLRALIGPLQGLAFALQWLNRLDEAEPFAEACLALTRPLVPESYRLPANPPEDDPAERAQFAHKLLGEIYRKQWKLGDAERITRESIAFDRRIYGEDHVNTGTSRALLALIQVSRGRLDDAEATVREALRSLGPRLEGQLVRSGGTASAITALLTLGDVMRRRETHDTAESMVSRVVTLRKELGGTEDPAVGAALLRLSEVYAGRGETARAVATAREGARLSEELRGRDDGGVCRARYALGRLLQLDGRLAEAEQVHRDALALAREVRGFRVAIVAEGAFELGWVLLDAGRREEAAPLIRESAELWASLVPEDELPLAEARLLHGVVEGDVRLVTSGADVVAERGDPLRRRVFLEQAAAFFAARGETHLAGRYRTAVEFR